jgi:pimeloyl-ACP methyl ester carboxylesterase
MMLVALAAVFALDATHHVRMMTTHPIDAASSKITRALVVIHGSGRDAEHAFDAAVEAAKLAHALDNTIIIAPRFSSNDGGLCNDVLEEHETNWGCEANNGWQAGGTAADDDRLTTFDVVDRLVTQLGRKDLFPNLSVIVVAGHSAGGQFVTRYSMANQVHDAVARTMLVRRSLGEGGKVRAASGGQLRAASEGESPVRYVVASPSSYAYPDSERPASHGSPAAGCNIFDDWPYGLRDRKGSAARLTPEDLARQLASRPVTYLLGALDNTTMRGLDTGCAAMAQGSSRLERGQVFAAHVNTRLGAHHRVVVVPGCAHDTRCVFTAASALPVLFPATDRGTLRP